MYAGLATAAGCQLVASCDIAVASTKSHFATPGLVHMLESLTAVMRSYKISLSFNYICTE